MRYLFLLLLFCVSVKLSRAQSGTYKQIDSIMRTANERGIFNGNILVAKKGKVIYQHSWGYADGSRTKMLTPDLRFDIGSISKEFNGTGIMILKERGLLSLDDPISKFLPALPAWSAKVKIRNLINYTSGIPPIEGNSPEVDSVVLAKLMSLKALSFEPGTAYIYNHYNVYLQMRIIEKVSGMPYPDFIKAHILIPCGMTSSAIDYPLTAENAAKAFDSEYKDTPYPQGMTGWVRLPVTDLYKWTECLHSYNVISKASVNELAANFPGGESSLGTSGFENGELVWHQHQGSNNNYEALFYSNLKEQVTIVMMTNNQQMKVYGIKSAILAALKGEPVMVPKKSVYLEMRAKILADPDKGLAFYRDLKANHQDKYDFSSEIPDLISTGKYLERRNKLDDAVKVFSVAVALNGKPADISYGYELIGECYFKKGDRGRATENYAKALEIDPKNKNAEGILATLKKAQP
jgi:CubicO group peptidase (beta-lactamase class C family)